MKRLVFLRLAIGAVGGLMLGCGDSGTEPDDVDSIDDLVARLATAGLAVTRSGPVEQPFVPVRGEFLTTGSQQIQVFDFGSSAAAAALATTVSADGSVVGNTQVSWVAPPHFYRSGALIVLYVGSDATVLGALTRVLGQQFAGR